MQYLTNYGAEAMGKNAHPTTEWVLSTTPPPNPLPQGAGAMKAPDSRDWGAMRAPASRGEGLGRMITKKKD